MKVAGKRREVEVYQILREEDASELTVMPRRVELQSLTTRLVMQLGAEILEIGAHPR